MRPDEIAQSEAAILGTLFENCAAILPPNIERLIEQAPESFDDLRHGEVACAMRALRQRGEPVSTVALDPLLKFEGHTVFLLSAPDRAVHLDAAESLAEKLLRQYVTRQSAGVLEDAREALQAAPNHAASIVGHAHRALEKLQIAGSTAPLAAEDVLAWVRGAIVAALTSRDEPWKQRQQIAAQVVEALAKIGRFYFHAEQRDFQSALYFNAQSKRLERIGSDSFAAWLSDLCKVNRGEGLFKNIFSEVQNAALTGPNTTAILPASFWSANPGAIYLSNGDGHLVKITGEGVTLADNGTDGVLFPVGATLAPWQIVEAQDPFTSCSLFRNVHSTAPHGKLLLQLWAYSMPTAPRSKPPVLFTGAVGSGKTRTAKGLAEFFGLPFIAAKVEENGEDDFWPAMDSGGLFTLDNVDTKNRWVADAIANAATDGCKSKRRLYTNAERVVLRPRAWLAVTSANPTFATDSGLADRLLVVRMGLHEAATADNALTDEILANRDAGLSHVAQTLSAALADKTGTPAGLNARHPDFGAFAVRIGRAMGVEGEAIAALEAAEQDKSVFCLENDSVAPALLRYVETVEKFEGSAADLLCKLRDLDPDLPENLTPRGLGRRLCNLMPHLAKTMRTAKATEGRRGHVFRFEVAGLRV